MRISALIFAFVFAACSEPVARDASSDARDAVEDLPRVDAADNDAIDDGTAPNDAADATVTGVPHGICTGRDADGGVPADTFPGPACTGVPDGTHLTRVPEEATSGPGWHVDHVAGADIFYVTEDHADIDALDIDIAVKIFANDVTIRRSRIRYAGYYLVFTADPPTAYHGLNLIDVELDGLGDATAQSIAVVATENAHFTRLNVHGVASSGPRLASGQIVEDSYLHDFACQDPDHSAGMSANDGGHDIVVRHNNIDIATSCATAAWEIALDFGTYDRVTTERNLFNGGSYCAYAGINVPGSAYPGATNVHFVDNVFGREHNAECGGFGPIAQWADMGGSEWRGNVWGDGAAATSAHRTGDPVMP